MSVDTKLIARFNAKWVKDEASGCHVWTGALMPNGYGQIKRPGERRQFYAHRLAWLIHKGPIPDGVSVLHRCDNRACVSVEPLFLGTQQANMQDMKEKGRHLYGQRNTEAKLTTEQVLGIRALKGILTQKEIATKFDISQGKGSRIMRGLRWQHLLPKKGD